MTREENQKNRIALRVLSDTLKLGAEMQGKEVKINTLLIEYYKNNNNVQELKSFEEWKKEGYQVKKGARGFAVWGKRTKEDNERKAFFPMAYLFAEKQVYKI